MKNEQNGGTHFVVCISNSDYPTSLEVRKIYQKLEDKEAESQNLLRVVDESGEDYLYPCECFIALPLPNQVEKVLTALPSS